MLTWIREKFGTVLISGIIGLIAMVFTFYGVFSPKSTRGLGEGAVAGTVNGDSISIAEFNRSYNERLEFFKNMAGGKLGEDQIKAFHLKQMVFQDLVKRRLMIQQASHQGLEPSDEEVMDRIREIQAFQKDGKFDIATYKQVLEANNHTAGSFERLVREDLSLQQWEGYFHDRSHVSEQEAKRDFTSSNDRRDIKYVLLTPDVGQHGIQIKPAEITQFLADATKLNLAKNQFEAKKEREFKGKTFDQVKETIAHDILAGQKVDEIQKINNALGDQVLALLKPDKASDAKVNALLKPYNVTVKATGWVTRMSSYVTGIGDAKELVTDAFAAKSPIDPASGGKAKKYSLPAGVLVAVTSESEKPDFAKFEKDRNTLMEQVRGRKERAVYEAWVQKLVKKAKIEPNLSVVGDET